MIALLSDIEKFLTTTQKIAQHAIHQTGEAGGFWLKANRSHRQIDRGVIGGGFQKQQLRRRDDQRLLQPSGLTRERAPLPLRARRRRAQIPVASWCASAWRRGFASAGVEMFYCRLSRTGRLHAPAPDFL